MPMIHAHTKVATQFKAIPYSLVKFFGNEIGTEKKNIIKCETITTQSLYKLTAYTFE